jgi:hypothetical protein
MQEIGQKDHCICGNTGIATDWSAALLDPFAYFHQRSTATGINSKRRKPSATPLREKEERPRALPDRPW